MLVAGAVEPVATEILQAASKGAAAPVARPAPLSSVLDALGVMLLSVSLDGRVAAWNAAARRTLGCNGGLARRVRHTTLKNNPQGVAGLQQQSASSRPELAESLGEVAGRIQAIAPSPPIAPVRPDS